ncbi:putative 39S ribosomal protein L44, mitochondrial [Hypsibius exemplaris]|uniref:Large ribosomal subunit protein mL44 n=1 Tax=Hypsibius exemplaris TaxID=2072580 RepID=A0A1W0XAY8_HYPEX|nr:putative 39S ribosomal protein L44, mitochondrial [Hypsibius exemplaris]
MLSKIPSLIRSRSINCGVTCSAGILQRPQASILRPVDQPQMNDAKSFGTSMRYPTQAGGFSRWDVKTRRAFFNLRREVGPEPLRHRDIWPNWNYEAELYAFGQRLGENTTGPAFRLAFIHESYARQEIERRKQLQIEDAHQMVFADQGALRDAGADIVQHYISAICRFNLPYLPEEGIETLTKYLLKTDVLANVSRHIGTSDLIQCAELPPYETTLADTLLAVIGALAEESGTTRAQHFVLDFLVTSLLDVDIDELWGLKNPMSVVADILQREGRAEPETRLLRRAGDATPEAIFLIGVYSDKKLIGQSFGETLLIAEEMAARETLRNFFRTTPSRKPMVFGKQARAVNVPVWSNTPNLRLADWTEVDCKGLLDSRLTQEPLLEQQQPPKKAQISSR